MQIVECEQGTSEWFIARMGMPTASEFATVMASGRGGGDSKTRKTYLHKLAGEIITGEPSESYSNAHMERGKVMEDEARFAYALVTGAEPQRIGFAVNNLAGCSPDSLIGNSGMLEIKTQLPHLLIATIFKDGFPPEHKAQCQGALWVCEREWIDISIYWPRMPEFIKRAHRDESYIAEIEQSVREFRAELDDTVARIRAYGRPVPAKEAA